MLQVDITTSRNLYDEAQIKGYGWGQVFISGVEVRGRDVVEEEKGIVVEGRKGWGLISVGYFPER